MNTAPGTDRNTMRERHPPGGSRLPEASLLKACLLAVILLCPCVGAVQDTFRVKTPPGYDDYADWIHTAGARRLEKMEHGMRVRLPRPVKVVLLPPGEGDMPDWASGWAGREGVFLRVNRMEDIPAVFTHELAHLLIWKAVGRVGAVPRWFEEGLAMHLSGENSSVWARMRVSLSGGPSLMELEHGFPTGSAEARRAYAKSYMAVSQLYRKMGEEGILRFMDRVGEGRSFHELLLEMTGWNVPAFDRAMKRRIRWNYVYIPLLTSSSFLWLALTLLFIVVYMRKRKRTMELMALWEEEEHDPDVPYH